MIKFQLIFIKIDRIEPRQKNPIWRLKFDELFSYFIIKMQSKCLVYKNYNNRKKREKFNIFTQYINI
jgi:hypothetical protein